MRLARTQREMDAAREWLKVGNVDAALGEYAPEQHKRATDAFYRDLATHPVVLGQGDYRRGYTPRVRGQ